MEVLSFIRGDCAGAEQVQQVWCKGVEMEVEESGIREVLQRC